jgi:Cu+-exporting ATPase
VAVLVSLAGSLAAQSAAQAVTKIELTELHCLGCARKIARKVNAVPGVAQMRADVKAKTLFVVHRPDVRPSPRALWEAVEQAGHTPTRMETPTGSYTSKPPA